MHKLRVYEKKLEFLKFKVFNECKYFFSFVMIVHLCNMGRLRKTRDSNIHPRASQRNFE